jgi:hypothetical protein
MQSIAGFHPFIHSQRLGTSNGMGATRTVTTIAGKAMPEASKPATSPVTARAVCLGLLVATLINLVLPYNDARLYNTQLIGNHFPVVSLALMMVLILAVNVGARRLFGVAGLSAGELLLVWGMIGVSGGICSAGIMRYLPTWVVQPAYYDNGTNEYGLFVNRHLPGWLLVSRDGSAPVVRWFMEGLPRGESIPWKPWIAPMAAWIAFVVLLYASNFAFMSLFFQQWSLRERIVFPVVQLPLLLAEEAPRGRWLNAFLANRLTWIGVLIPCVVWGVNGLRSYFPAVPAIPTSFSAWNIFPDRPWSEFHLGDAKLYFTVIGITFLLTTEVAFSLWFFYVLVQLSWVFIAWRGAGATGFWGNWSTRTGVFEYAGSVLAIAAFLFWTARGFLKEWWSRVVKGGTDSVMDPINPRFALALMATGVLGMVGWCMLAGSQWWVSILVVVMLLAIVLVLTRVVAEAGLISVHSGLVSHEMITGLVPPSWFTGGSVAGLTMHRAMFGDLREIFMPYLANGLRAAASARMHLGKVLAVLALTAAVSLGTSAFSRIVTAYKYGALNMDPWATVWAPNWYLGEAVSFQKNPPSFEFAGIGETKLIPVNAAHVGVGAALTAALLALRARYLWWPLHPFGLVMCTTWVIWGFWFSIFLGWLAKASIMTFGGAAAFRRALPFFLGLALGESLIAAFWILLGLATGTPGISVLPW